MQFAGTSFNREVAGVCECACAPCVSVFVLPARAVSAWWVGKEQFNCRGKNANANTSSPTKNGVGFL